VKRAFLAALLTAFTCNSSLAADLPADWQDGIRLGVRAYEKGENRVAFDTFYKMMVDGQRKFGASDGRMLRLYTNMGQVYDEEKQYQYAEDCLKKALSVGQKSFGDKAVELVPPLIDLGQVYVHESRDFLAKPLFEKALAITDKSEDEQLIGYAAVAEANLASMYYAQGNYPFGEPHFKRALELATKSFGPTHKWTTTIGGMYAACLHAQGKAKEAKLVEKAARAKANENQSPFAVWNRQITLAEQAIAAKKFPDAEAALKAATQALTDPSMEPMLQVITLNRHGQMYLSQGKPTLAIEKWKAAQALADSVLGAEDAVVLDHAKQLADLEKSQNQYREAEPLYARLVAATKNHYGAESEEYAKALSDLADLCSAGAQYPKAVTYYGKLLAWQEKKFGVDSDKLIPTLVALGTAAQNNTQFFSEVNEKAEAHLKRAAIIATKHFGKNSKELTGVWDSLSRYYQRHLDWDKAAKTCTMIIAADEKTFGPDSAETIKALEHYAVVLRAAGLRDQAEPVEARIAKIKGTSTPAD
jgi:tetratricopeptide (TPR) repeat protein